MNQNKQKVLLEILDRIQSGGDKNSNPESETHVPNSVIADHLTKNNVKVAPVAIGDKVYAVKQYSIPCYRCEHRADTIGLCIHECPKPDYRIDTIEVDDVSKFCYLTLCGDIELRKDFYKSYDEACDALRAFGHEPDPRKKPRLLDLDGSLVAVKLHNVNEFTTVCNYLLSVGITKFGTGDGTVSTLENTWKDAFKEQVNYLTVNFCRTLIPQAFVSVGKNDLARVYDFNDLDWSER